MTEPASVPPPAAVAETHISTVLFDGDLAVKRYKPVRTGFLDHTTVDGRRRDCEREVALNRRLAPDVYLGVAEVRGPDGEVCDHLVLMRRLDPSRRLATLVRAGGGRAEVAAVARVMAAFHAGADRSPAIDAVATPEALERRWAADLAELASTGSGHDRPGALAEVGELAHRALRARRPMLDARVADGHVVDGQGDLLADDIFCLEDGPRILDCLAFAHELRWGDVAADLAFLAMDLEHLGRPDLATSLWSSYGDAAGDHAPAALVDLYVAQRAVVRAKVHALRADQLAVDDPARLEEEAAVDEFVALSLDHLRRAEPRVILVGGSPGTGKSTLARGIGEQRGWAVVRSDDVRRELRAPAGGHEHGRAPDAADPDTIEPDIIGSDATESDATESEAADADGIEQGGYAPDVTRQVYDEVVRRGLVAVGAGASVVLDASWRSAADRHRAADAAAALGARVTSIRCVAPPDVCRQRVARRLAEGVDASEATPTVADWMAAHFEDWPDAIEVDTTGPKVATLDATSPTLGPPPSDVR